MQPISQSYDVSVKPDFTNIDTKESLLDVGEYVVQDVCTEIKSEFQYEENDLDVRLDTECHMENVKVEDCDDKSLLKDCGLELNGRSSRIKLEEGTFKNATSEVNSGTKTQKAHSKSASTNEFICATCNFATSRKDLLITHMVVHSEVYPFKCTQCSYVAKRKVHLKSHIINKHTKEYPYKCSQCEYKTISKFKLNVHVLNHSGERPFKCPDCGFAVTSNARLLRHNMYVHSTDRPYVCTICRKGFVQNYKLKRHMLHRHENLEKSIKCEQCDFMTTTVDQLKQHKRNRHSAVKPFKCEFCDYACVSSGMLKSHMYKHGMERPYKCYDCSYRAVQPCILMKHIERRHT